MTNSDLACPKCGKFNFWQEGIFLNKSGKTITIVARCSHCHRNFKMVKHLARCRGNWKLIKEVV